MGEGKDKRLANLTNAGKGRKTGVPNKLTRDLKEMIEGALVAVGGQRFLEKQAVKKPEAFMALLGKCLPRDINVGGGLKLQVNLVSRDQASNDG